MFIFQRDFISFIKESNSKYSKLALEEAIKLEGKSDYHWEQRVKAVLDGIDRGKFSIYVSYPLSNEDKIRLSFYILLLKFYGADWNSWKVYKDTKTAVAITR